MRSISEKGSLRAIFADLAPPTASDSSIRSNTTTTTAEVAPSPSIITTTPSTLPPAPAHSPVPTPIPPAPAPPIQTPSIHMGDYSHGPGTSAAVPLIKAEPIPPPPSIQQQITTQPHPIQPHLSAQIRVRIKFSSLYSSPPFFSIDFDGWILFFCLFFSRRYSME